MTPRSATRKRWSKTPPKREGWYWTKFARARARALPSPTYVPKGGHLTKEHKTCLLAWWPERIREPEESKP